MNDESPGKKTFEVVNRHPIVRFGVNMEFDIGKITEIIKTGVDTKRLNDDRLFLYNTHPGLMGFESLDPGTLKKKVAEYVYGQYSKNADQIKGGLQVIERDWREIEDKYFESIERVYPLGKWPEGAYIGYHTITYPCPRFLDSKVFQVRGADLGKYYLFTIAEELHHFWFYEQIRRLYCPELSNTIETGMYHLLDKRFKVGLWDMSEIIVMIHLSQEPFSSMFPAKRELYPKHLPLYPVCRENWERSGRDLEKFLELMLK